MKKTTSFFLFISIPFIMMAQEVEKQTTLINSERILAIKPINILQKKKNFQFNFLQQQEHVQMATLSMKKLELPELKKPNRLQAARVDHNFQKRYKNIFGKEIRVSQ